MGKSPPAVCSATQECLTLWNPMDCRRLSCPSLSPGVCSNSCLLSWWCYLTTSSYATLFSFCLQSFPASASFPMSQLFASGGQSIEASASVLPMNIQGSFPLRLTGLISWLSKGLSRVFSSTTVGKHVNTKLIYPKLAKNTTIKILLWFFQSI